MAEHPKSVDLERARRRLRERHADLLAEVESLEADATTHPDGQHVDRQDDGGAIAETQNDDYDVLRHEDRLLRAVSEGLRRIEEGTYGRCTRCGRWIEEERLELLPHAERCVACARRDET